MAATKRAPDRRDCGRRDPIPDYLYTLHRALQHQHQRTDEQWRIQELMAGDDPVLREIPRSPNSQISGLLPFQGLWLRLYLARSTHRREFSQLTLTNHFERVAENWPCQYLA